ncbi:MAG TPA: hypothetical protein VGH44_06225 [Candidatus Saccharimonadia bacterium]|jgi:hypothetical protein
MKSTEFQDLLKQVEAQFFQYEFQYGDAINAILNDHEDRLTAKQKDAIRREVIAFRFHTADTTRQKTQERLNPMIELTNGTKFPDKSTLKEDDLDYYHARSQACPNPVMKMRYLDVLWELDMRSGRHEIGQDLVRASIAASNIFDHENEFNRVDCLNRSLQVSLQLGKTGAELTQQAASEVARHLERLRKNNIRYTLELIQTLLDNHQCFDQPALELCDKICDEAIRHYSEDNVNFTLHSAFIELKYDVKRYLNKGKPEQKEKARLLAQVQIEEAERRTDSIFVQQHFLAQAQKILRDAGLNDEARQLGLRVEKLGRSPKLDAEFKSVSVQQTIPQETINDLEKLLKKHEDISAVIAISPNFMPSWEAAKELAAKEETAYISDMFTGITVDENGIPVASTPGDTGDKKILRYFQIEVELKTSILAQLLRKLLKDKALKLNNFEIQFEKVKSLDDSTYKSIRHGLKLFLEGDSYSASLVLATQLEDLIFRLLPAMEVGQYIQEPDGRTYSPKTLGIMLPEIRSVVGEDNYRLLTYTLIDKAHHNLRNKIGHGKTKITDDNFLRCTRLIQLFSSLLVHVNITDTDQHGHGSKPE